VKLQAIIPAYRAASTVGPVVEQTARVVRDVLVVDDGSPDDTSGAAKAAGARVLRLPEHRGKGFALRAGFSEALAAGCAAVVTLDADGQHDPGEIVVLIDCWRRTGAALVIGSRAHLEEGMTPLRRFGNRFSRRALSRLSGVPVTDSQSGFRLYDAALLRAVPLRGDGYEMESEVIVRAARAGFRVACTPVRLLRVAGEGTSHYRPWRDTARICVAVLRARYLG
jgi:glycosyltransferase involved in cell wall biosynthesis